jgi:CheY-like chemotaxis protein
MKLTDSTQIYKTKDVGLVLLSACSVSIYARFLVLKVYIYPILSKLVFTQLNLTNNHSNLERKKKTIMICDDERDVLDLFGLMFGSKYDVIMVDSGEECIEKYIEETNRDNKIDLILLDYRMGGMQGDSVARKIKELNGTKIILISAYDVEDGLIKELENGNYISQYVKKPIETERLTNLVSEIVR